MRTRSVILVLLVLLVAGCGGPSEGKPGADGGAGGGTGAAAGGAAGGASGGEPTGSGAAAALRTVTIQGSGAEEVEVRVEIADEPEEQARGLMGRTALGEDRGMLFAFGEEEVRSFWMKDTLIPLSIAYMDAEGRIVDLQDMKPLDDDLPHYVSKEPARYALEVNRGFFDERGVEVGDRADLPG